MMKTCSAKKRLRVAPPIVSPPRMKRASAGPITGARSACSAPTTTDQTALASQRRSCPVKPMPSVSASSSTPLSQLSSRGNLYEPCRKTWERWTKTMTTIADAPQ
ncbi:MAG: hypothetical protein U0575_11090 [Phycisphaerales bacterium]